MAATPTVSLAKPVSLTKRRVPNIDTLLRSYPRSVTGGKHTDRGAVRRDGYMPRAATSVAEIHQAFDECARLPAGARHLLGA